MLFAGALGGVVFVTLLGHRSDYAGHFLAGYGGTLLLLAVPLASLRDVLRLEVLACVVVAIGLGAALEATVFRLAIFDPVDFANQSLGAVLAGLTVLDRRPSLVAGGAAFALALVFLSVGAAFAFA